MPARRGKSALLLPALMAGALYFVTLRGTYVYDDAGIILDDPRIAHPAWWYQFWTQGYNGQVDNLYRPITSLTYAIQWWLHGNRPWAFHSVNILLHAIASTLVALLAMRLTELSAFSRGACSALSSFQKAEARSKLGGYTQTHVTLVGLIAGLLFASHPVHVEAVANIVGRAELLCAIGFIGGLVLFLHRPLTNLRVLGITACFLLAMLSKEMGIIFPLVLLALAICRRIAPRANAETVAKTQAAAAPVVEYATPDVESSEAREHRASVWLVVSMCWLLSGYIILREQVIHLRFWWPRSFLEFPINPLVRMNTFERLLMPITIFGHYLALLVAPIHLSPDYSGKTIGLHLDLRDPYFILGAIGVIVWLALFVWFIVKRNGPAIFCLLAFGLTYGVVSNFASLIGTIFGERLIYLPSAFFLILIAMALARIGKMVTATDFGKSVAVTIFLSLLALACWRTVTYARLWNNPPQLYRNAIEHHPDAIRLYILLGADLRNEGKLAESKAVLDEGTKRLPGYWEIWVQAGVTALAQNDFDEAERCLLRAQNLQPGLVTSYWLNQLAIRRAATQPAQHSGD